MKIAGLFVHPIKSLQAISVLESEVERRGLRHDRRLMLVDDAGLFQTQRRLGRMARLRPEIVPGGLRVHAEDGRVEIDLSRVGERVPVEIWGHLLLCERAWPELDPWFSERLGLSVRLVRMPESAHRPTSAEYSEPGDEVSLADGYPVLMTGTASLADLNARLEEPVPMDRFRPNVVLEGAGAWEEEAHAEWLLGEVRMRYAKPCVRCKVTTLDQSTGEPTGPEPLRTLATFRRSGGGVAFGANLIPASEGVIRVGDRVSVVR